MGMMGKLKEAQKKIEETKKRLDSVYVTGTADGEKVKVTMSVNREVKDIYIDPSLEGDLEQISDLMVIAMNQGLKKANDIQEAELGAAAKEGMPNIPGMENLLR